MFNLQQAENTDLIIIYKVDIFSDSIGLSLWEVQQHLPWGVQSMEIKDQFSDKSKL